MKSSFAWYFEIFTFPSVYFRLSDLWPFARDGRVKNKKKQPQKHVKQTKFTQSCCKFSVNHSPRVQYVQLKSNSKNNFYLLDIFFIFCIYFFWTNNKNQTIKHMHNVLLVLKYHSDTLSLLRLVPKTG